MPRFDIDHSTDPSITATAGWDHAVGFFVDVTGNGTMKSYSSVERNYNHERPLMGALRFLQAHGYYSEDELHDALSGLYEGTIDELPATVRVVAEIVRAFKRAAD